ncbi:MAG: hypothetical protein ACYTFQ_33135 [Planctomycetota bacterium]|jgi:hypothetical protein
MIQSASVTITGAATGYVGTRIRGRILAIKSDAALNAAYTVAITGETTGIPILAAAAVSHNSVTWFHPRALASLNTAGTDGTDAFVEIPIFNERIKIVTSVAATGTVTLTVLYDADT